MKILQINCVYRQGSTGKLGHDLHTGLQERGISSLVLYGRGERCREKGVQKLCSEGYAKGQNLLSRFRGTLYGGCWLSTWRLLRILQKEQPDVVHLQCTNGYFVNSYCLISWLKKHRVKTVLTLHAEFPYTANCSHAYDCEGWKTGCGQCPRWRQETHSLVGDGTARSFENMRRAFQGFEKDLTVVSVSPWLENRARVSPILQDMCHKVIYNGVDTRIFSYSPTRKTGGQKVIFQATAMFQDQPGHEKGGWLLLELAKRLRNYPVRFLVAGTYRLRGKIPENVMLLGEIQDQQRLAQYYREADVTLLTSRRETFSMVCAESLCCGTPVVGFQAGGPESVFPKEWAVFVPWKDLDALEEAVRACLERDWDRREIACQAGTAYSKEGMLGAYIQLYRGLLDENQC